MTANFRADLLAKSRWTVCGNSKDAEEAAHFMRMLGIHPSQEEDELYEAGVPELPTKREVPHTPPRRLPSPLNPPAVRPGDFGTQRHRVSDPKGN